MKSTTHCIVGPGSGMKSSSVPCGTARSTQPSALASKLLTVPPDSVVR